MSKRDMAKWFQDLAGSPVKRAMPILSFPCAALLGITVRELITNSCAQARGMKLIAERVPSAASVGMMDLSVEAEAFGAQVRFSDDEVPTVVGHIIEDTKQAPYLAVPAVGRGRTGIYIDAIGQACALITDRPVFAGVIGPFSLAGRLLDVTEIMVYCYDEPEMVHTVLLKAAEFITNYIKAFREAGADGVLIAEPLAGLLSPAMNREFSARYLRQIVGEVRRRDFAVIYHNCGNGTPLMTDDIYGIGADAYHFGNAVDMARMLEKTPRDVILLGNIDPAGQFRNGTPESIRAATTDLLKKCGGYKNFIISSGCDIPPRTPWENIDAFFEAVMGFYE